MALIVVAGGHGKIARLLHPLLADAGHQVHALIRNPDHASDLEGAEGVVCDLEREDDLSDWVRGADAVVFAAGAGPGSGPERKRTVDLGGAVKLIRACRATGVDRYLMVSSMGAEDPASAPEAMRPYQLAKGDADRELISSGLAFTICRPGMLTDDDGTGKVTIGDSVGRSEVPRADVAAVLAECLARDETVGRKFEVVSGDTPIADAVASL